MGGITMIIGIDLGTTNSLAAYYTEEGPRIIPNRLGERLTPSAVSIDENDQVYVGRSALERMAVHPDEGASLFKRSMGSRKEFVLGKRTFSAEELSSFALRSLKEDRSEERRVGRGSRGGGWRRREREGVKKERWDE